MIACVQWIPILKERDDQNGSKEDPSVVSPAFDELPFIPLLPSCTGVDKPDGTFSFPFDDSLKDGLIKSL